MYRVASNGAKALNLMFSVPKIDLIHWRTPKDKTPRYNHPFLIRDQLIHPSKSFKWLGIWLQDHHSTHQHFTKRLNLTKFTWVIERKLSDLGKGLNPCATCHLSQVPNRPTMRYVTEIFTPSVNTLAAITSFWRKIGIWVTNYFHSSSYAAVQLESFLPSLPPLIKFIQTKYALRIIGTHPFKNPTLARFPPNAPIYWIPKPPKRFFHFKHRLGIYFSRT
jgi:hypothetical protein